jgi:hypothetical protein
VIHLFRLRIMTARRLDADTEDDYELGRRVGMAQAFEAAELTVQLQQALSRGGPGLRDLTRRYFDLDGGLPHGADVDLDGYARGYVDGARAPTDG